MIKFEKSTDPQNLIDYEAREAEQAREYAKKGIIYGSASYTDFVCVCDGLLMYFEAGLTVEDALSSVAIEGYRVADAFGYEMSEAEARHHREYIKKCGWDCFCEVCE